MNSFDSAKVLFQEALVRLQEKNWAAAELLLKESLALLPDRPSTLNNLFVALINQKKFDAAKKVIAASLSIQPDFAESWSNQGILLKNLNLYEAALQSFDKALEIDSQHSQTWCNRGVLLNDINQFENALSSLDRAIEIHPDATEAWTNRGISLDHLNRHESALDSHDRALKLNPGLAEAWSNRGNTLNALKRYKEALDSCDHAVLLQADFAEAWFNRGHALIGLKRHSEAASSFERTTQIDADHAFAAGELLHQKMMCCDWGIIQALAIRIAQDISHRKKSATPFGYQAIAESEAALKSCAEIYAGSHYPAPSLQFAATHKENRKIRIGYVCGEFRDQATSVLACGLYEMHDKEKFEIFAFDSGWDDGSDIRRRIRLAFNEIVDISKLSDHEASIEIQKRNIDILVNLNGYFGEARQGIFGYRPSPLQVNYLGFPGTIGADYMDYLIADRIVIPESSAVHYTEKIAYLPNCYQANDRRRSISDRVFTRSGLGLPQQGFIFCCFNNNYKITPGTFDSWMRILKSVEGSVLWLLEDNPDAAFNLGAEAAKRGVAAHRLIFAPRMPLPEHLARHRAADLFLDTLPYNAHTTASDALWAGLPVLTQTGSTFPGRVATSLLTAIGLQELITRSQTEYETMAMELANDSLRLTSLREKLSHNRLSMPLFDTALFTTRIESVYIKMLERHRARLPPAQIYIEN